METPFYLCVPAAKHIVVSGDIHGEFNTLVYKLCVQQANNWIVFVRGNHDNPAYFNGNAFAYKRFIAVPDYAVIQACNKTILGVGGGISIDRVPRKEKWKLYYHRYREFLHIPDNSSFARNFYWKDEPPVYDETLLEVVGKKYSIDTVISHTAPSFCEKISKSMVEHFAQSDPTLLQDVQAERETMDAIFHKLIADGHI